MQACVTIACQYTEYKPKPDASMCFPFSPTKATAPHQLRSFPMQIWSNPLWIHAQVEFHVHITVTSLWELSKAVCFLCVSKYLKKKWNKHTMQLAFGSKVMQDVFLPSPWQFFSSHNIFRHLLFNEKRDVALSKLMGDIWAFLIFRCLQKMLYARLENETWIWATQSRAIATFSYFQCLGVKSK